MLYALSLQFDYPYLQPGPNKPISPEVVAAYKPFSPEGEGLRALRSQLQLRWFDAKGANTSLIHVDWMIGSNELDIDGVLADGITEPLMRKGDWAA